MYPASCLLFVSSQGRIQPQKDRALGLFGALIYPTPLEQCLGSSTYRRTRPYILNQ